MPDVKTKTLLSEGAYVIQEKAPFPPTTVSKYAQDGDREQGHILFCVLPCKSIINMYFVHCSIHYVSVYFNSLCSFDYQDVNSGLTETTTNRTSMATPLTLGVGLVEVKRLDAKKVYLF